MEEELNKELTKKGFYDNYYKFLLIIPLILFILSISYLSYFYHQNHDIIKKDVSLKGGTSITINSNGTINIVDLKKSLLKKIDDFSIREISDFNTGKQEAIIIESPVDAETLKKDLEDILGYKLVSGENASIEFSGSALSEDFYQQLVYAIVLSFSFMALVVFFVFGGRMKIKLLTITLTLIPMIMFFSHALPMTIAMIFQVIVLIINLFIFLKDSIPSVAVVISAFADILMTLAFVDFIGIRLSSAGIIAFLMLIGYSVDTDIMLTTRLLKKKDEDSLNKKLSNAFKTGITMTLSSMVAVGVALIFTYSFSEILKQIFTIVFIGLSFDIINTWITNASLLKWYLEKKNG